MTAPRDIGKPEPGFFQIRKVRGGPFVGARLIYGPPSDPETGEPLDRSHEWETWIDGRLVRDPSPDPVAAGVYRVWTFGTPIAEAEYQFLVDHRAWARTNASDSPEANAGNPIDISTKRPLF